MQVTLLVSLTCDKNMRHHFEDLVTQLKSKNFVLSWNPNKYSWKLDIPKSSTPVDIGSYWGWWFVSRFQNIKITYRVGS